MADRTWGARENIRWAIESDEDLGRFEPIAARLEGRDQGHLEHLLQARLSTQTGVSALGFTGRLLRGVPASSPGQRRAFIDLIGVDTKGAVHVVETKLGLAPGLTAEPHQTCLTSHHNSTSSIATVSGGSGSSQAGVMSTRI